LQPIEFGGGYAVSPIGQLLPTALDMLREQDVATVVINISQLEPRLVNYLDHHDVERFSEIVCKELEVMAMLATENSYFRAEIALLGESVGSIGQCVIQLRYSDSTS
jgi:hypothetical protein